MTDDGARIIATALAEVFSGHAVVERDMVSGVNLVDQLHGIREALDRLADAGFDIARAIERSHEREP
jgi:hypothetical protein